MPPPDVDDHEEAYRSHSAALESDLPFAWVS